MSQQTALFQKALAAKLTGDEDGFKRAIREAIVAKTKALVSESFGAPQGFSASSVQQISDTEFSMPIEDVSKFEALGLTVPSSEQLDLDVTVSVNYWGGEQASRSEPGSGPELEFEVTQGSIVADGQVVQQLTPQQATALISETDYEQIHNLLMGQAQKGPQDDF